jgi:hypothetical protein
MPIEDLTGDKYIGDLNSDWPLFDELQSLGDDHIRGVKNVLKKQFPNLGLEPMTRTAANLNRGSVPIGARTSFYLAAAPSGWVRVSLASDYTMHVVSDAGVGGASGGADNPILNNKVTTHTHAVAGDTASTNPAHSHSVSFNSGVNSTNHTHGYSNTTATDSPDHDHSLLGYYVLGGGGVGVATGTGRVIATTLTSGARQRHTHSFSGNTGAQSANHVHGITGNTNSAGIAHVHSIAITSAAPGGATVGTWAPRYLDMILCERQT